MAAALKCCRCLHEMGELDHYLQPVGKESMRLDDHLCPPPPDDQVPEGMPRPGTTKRRQYYYKKVPHMIIIIIINGLLGDMQPINRHGNDDNKMMLKMGQSYFFFIICTVVGMGSVFQSCLSIADLPPQHYA